MRRRLARVPWWGYWLVALAAIVASFFARAEFTTVVLLALGPFVAIAAVTAIAIWSVLGDMPESVVQRRSAPRRSPPAIRARAEVSQPGPRALVGEVLPRRHELEGGKR